MIRDVSVFQRWKNTKCHSIKTNKIKINTNHFFNPHKKSDWFGPGPSESSGLNTTEKFEGSIEKAHKSEPN